MLLFSTLPSPNTPGSTTHVGTAALSGLNTDHIHLLTIKMQVATNLLHILHFINTWCRATLSSSENKLVVEGL